MKEKRNRRPLFIALAVALVLVIAAAAFSTPAPHTTTVEEPLKAEAFLR